MASNSDNGYVFCTEITTTFEGRRQLANNWVMDSGATWHMTSWRKWFHKYEIVFGGSMSLANDHVLDVIGINIKLKMHDVTIHTI